MQGIVCPIECVKSGCDNPPSWLEKHESFVLTCVSLLSGLLGGIFAYFLKSRCSKINLCYCLQCERQPIELTVSDVAANSQEPAQPPVQSQSQ